MGKNNIYLICFRVTYKKIFLKLLTEKKKIILKNFVTHGRPHTAKIRTLSKASGLKSHLCKTLKSEIIYPV